MEQGDNVSALTDDDAGVTESNGVLDDQIIISCCCGHSWRK